MKDFVDSVISVSVFEQNVILPEMDAVDLHSKLIPAILAARWGEYVKGERGQKYQISDIVIDLNTIEGRKALIDVQQFGRNTPLLAILPVPKSSADRQNCGVVFETVGHSDNCFRPIMYGGHSFYSLKPTTHIVALDRVQFIPNLEKGTTDIVFKAGIGNGLTAMPLNYRKALDDHKPAQNRRMAELLADFA